MTSIQATTGLISGIPITDTVDKLMKLAAVNRDNLETRTETLKQKQAAITELAALLLSSKYLTTNLGKTDLFEQQKATSSNDAALTATVTGSVPAGTYSFTPLQVAQSQQWLSSGVKSDTASLGTGSLSFRFGDTVQRSMPLEVLNGGEGVTRGKIRITDGSGASAEIDLGAVQNFDDVLDAINSNSQINVTAKAVGDRIQLTDNTGLSLAHLKVQEVNGGTTAASLGLDGIDTTEAVAVGDDLIRLSSDLELDVFNDGAGVRTNPALPDIRYQLRDGTSGMIDFSPLAIGGSSSTKETKLGELIDVINQTAPGKLKAEIGPDGERLVITDLTTGTESFSLESLYESDVLEDLGLDQTAVDGVITGQRILGGLQSVLVSSLNGGNGYGQLGTLNLTDRTGATATVDLNGAETLDAVIERINAAGVGIRAQVNEAGTGLQLVDTTQAASGRMVVANGDDGRQTATKLGIAADAEVASVNSGDMHLRVISYNTQLADLNGGKGVTSGSVTILDSSGKKAILDLTTGDYKTIGDVVKGINRLNLQVYADLNATGDGIQIRDLAGGTGKLQVQDSTTAADLHIVGTATATTVDGNPTQILSGSSTTKITLTAEDTLQTLRDKINKLGAGLNATIIQDGSSRPYRLSLTSSQTGRQGEVVLDASGLGLSLDEVVDGKDAVVALSFGGDASKSLLVSSSTNTFTNVVDGLKLQVKQASTTPVSIAVTTDPTNLVANVKTFVDNYNKFRKRLSELSEYNSDTSTKALLTGDSTALRLDVDLSNLLSGRFYGAGSIRSLGELGVSFNDDGTLALDETKLKDRFQSDPSAVKEFFTTTTSGFSAKFNKLSEQLVGQDVSLVAQRYKSFSQQISDNEERLETMDSHLAAQRTRLLTQFYNMESAIAKLQTNEDLLDQLKKQLYQSSSS